MQQAKILDFSFGQVFSCQLYPNTRHMFPEEPTLFVFSENLCP